MQALLDQLLALLRCPGRARAGRHGQRPGQTLAVSADQVEALGKYMADAAARDSVDASELPGPAVRPRITSSGRLATSSCRAAIASAPELTPAFSEIEVRGEGPQRQIERVPLPDIRSAVERHPVFILLAQPGAGKTTVLQRLALDQALARLHDPARRRCLSSCGWQPEGRRDRPTSSWPPLAPGDAGAARRATLNSTALCNRAGCASCVTRSTRRARDGYRSACDDWRDFAAGLPAGNRLVFTCRTQDYQGELKVKQVEIDPLSDEQIQEFARRYLDDDAAGAFWAALRSTHAALLPLARDRPSTAA